MTVISSNMKAKKRYVLSAICVSLTVLLVLKSNLFTGLTSIGKPQKSPLEALSNEGILTGNAHLHFPRKDLDKSNYTVGDEAQHSENLKFASYISIRSKQGPTSQEKHTPSDKRRYQPTEGMRRVISGLYEHVVVPSGVDALQLNKYYQTTQRWPFVMDRGKPLPAFRNYQKAKHTRSWERFHLGIRQFSMYDPNNDYIDQLIADIQREDIVKVEMKEGGTQLKLVLTFADEGQSLFKPMRYARSYQTPPDHFYFSDFERHNAEIAAYHLDRVLGFYRSPPVVGRTVNITSELKNHANKPFVKTFFVSPADNVCFTGKCSYYCDTGHAFCGRPDTIQGSFAAFLPSLTLAPRVTYQHPWRRSYSKHKKAEWETDEKYCDTVKEISIYNGSKRMLDLMDMAIYDFIIGNMDRHHYEVFPQFGNDTFVLHLDHGRSFGRVDHDELSILAPIRQCCLVRHTTFVKLISLHNGPVHLSDALRGSLARDRLTPVLADGHFEAVDRRVAKVLVAIATCVNKARSPVQVIMDDGF